MPPWAMSLSGKGCKISPATEVRYSVFRCSSHGVAHIGFELPVLHHQPFQYRDYHHTLLSSYFTGMWGRNKPQPCSENSSWSPCLCLPSPGITGVQDQAWLSSYSSRMWSWARLGRFWECEPSFWEWSLCGFHPPDPADTWQRLEKLRARRMVSLLKSCWRNEGPACPDFPSSDASLSPCSFDSSVFSSHREVAEGKSMTVSPEVRPVRHTEGRKWNFQKHHWATIHHSSHLLAQWRKCAKLRELEQKQQTLTVAVTRKTWRHIWVSFALPISAM